MIEVNALGDVCPVPVIKARKALKQIENDGAVLVIVDNEISRENLEKMASEMGYKYITNEVNKDRYEVKIIKGKHNIEPSEPHKALKIKHGSEEENIAMVISSDRMGEGSQELGEILMKAFIYAVTESEKLPDTIIFYNGGAKLTAKGSPVVEHLQTLNTKGVEILTCGTCSNYYNLTDNLAVGELTNMYNIYEKIADADKIIKP
ncbi:sulfurtransferase-like selenium metabolism protein YedF [Clostridium tyrobutyricum]|jgi:selenium metabolism protein YedF|uniref:UPF0033 domain-containing protein n=1 Tax=Clostridium tyrobutyricum DIVETGP TaxID=1408889 RepID=W6N826_CLOTY|nr:sulfurtransferase-like selenium metabolism protein YedF [Clostridium tyrobutyricum]AND84602.1 SirA family protein [Clostridium tyrobutyricum]ANP69208.1 response regulator SirA [Clostridium tyrobutyricum]MBR9648674.1 sulfurtransferase-like selenium metabolism protein YedF [Clostridium tyrobutyricum]MBV4415587.1 sulfurtransferase-like selenium metabolism protein YedF [Clostridium tyrobutyricum]MBV4421332.1 sulfurtransferase-like selenium metabolism protein YedF [Clostridium tyrobutyricum]